MGLGEWEHFSDTTAEEAKSDLEGHSQCPSRGQWIAPGFPGGMQCEMASSKAVTSSAELRQSRHDSAMSVQACARQKQATESTGRTQDCTCTNAVSAIRVGLGRLRAGGREDSG